MTESKLFLFLSIFFFHQLALAQISPPGMGLTKTAGWFAAGLRQDLDTLGRWQSMSYAGIGRKSAPGSYNPVLKPAIAVVNQEFYHQVCKRWQYSFALSYRRQDEYRKTPPYEHSNPSIKQEFRLYGRWSYMLQTARIKLTTTVRQEFRKFYTPDFRKPDENFQLRSRFRVQLAVNLDTKKTHRLIAGSEQLFSISREGYPIIWTDFAYHESRFSLYYSFSPPSASITLSAGYMNNLIRHDQSYPAHYLALDIVFINPFSAR